MAHFTTLVQRLKKEFGEAYLRSGEEAGPDYGRDESLKVVPIVPAVVFTPRETSQVAIAIRLAAESDVPVTTRGSGTGLSGACIPQPNGLVISFERMNAIREIDPKGHVAIVEPGVTLAQLDAETEAHNLIYPVFPGTNAATIGGNVATNAGGIRAVKYGVTRRHVLGVEAVTGTGDVIRTGGRFVKSSTGYDLTQLLVGSEGTLALITEATLQLQPRMSRTASNSCSVRLRRRCDSCSP